MKINIDKHIDRGHCPVLSVCTVATTCYSQAEREHICYNCWLDFCKRHSIEIVYGDEKDNY